VDEGIEALTARAARQLEALGHRVDIAQRFDGAEEVNEGWSLLSAAGLASLGARDAAFARPDALGAAARSTLATGLELPAHQLLDLFAAVRRLRAAIGELFVGHDVLLTPATAALPWPIDRTHPEVIAGTPVGPRGHAVFTAFANAAGLPAIAVPCGLLQGLPAGIQLVGPSGSDELLVALASQFEHAHPWAHLWPEE
jgi:aspartyl-tRNA(Asn)/glutamyl-tRNA(Gln) amidotransferase subunit A